MTAKSYPRTEPSDGSADEISTGKYMIDVAKSRGTRIDIKKLSIVGKEYHTEEHVVGYYNAGDRMK